MVMPWSTVKPFPYDLIVQPEDGSPVGVMLKPSQEGQMVGQHSRRIDAVTPSTYGYADLNPYKEAPYVFGPLTGGLGESRQQGGGSGKRYKYGRRVDCSIAGQRRLGPKFTGTTVSAGDDVNYMAPGTHNSADAIFALVMDKVYYNAAGGWIISRTDAGGNSHRQGVQYKGTAGSDRFWVTTYPAGELWGYDGAAWAMAALPAGFKAYFVEKVGDELWAFGGDANGDNVLRVVTTGDPMLAASWGGAIFVGSADKGCTWLRAIDDKAYLFKQDGIFSVTNDAGTVTVHDLFPDLRDVTFDAHGEKAAPWNGYLWFQFGDGFWRLDGDGNLDPIGPERLNGLDSRLRRPGVAFAGHGTWFGYLVTQASDLLKFGAWVNPGSGDPDAFADVWNGSLADWNSKTATSIIVSAAAEGTPNLYIGFNDGSIEQTRLPQFSPDPADDSDCRFVTGGVGEESYVEWPDHHAMAQIDPKHARAFAAEGPVIDATTYVTIDYRTSEAAAWTPLGTSLTASGTKVVTPDPLTGGMLFVRENLHGTANVTPEVESVVLMEQIRPALELEYRVTALARHNAARKDGCVDRRTAEQVRAALKATAGPGPATVWMPDGTRQMVDFVDVGEVLANPNARYGVEWEIPLAFVQWKTL